MEPTPAPPHDRPELGYDVVDVFVDPDAPGFSGNQLAVVHGAGALVDDQLLAITREFGYSESTFPTPAGPAAYDVRIFTPDAEVPFAGHPTLGTAWVLRHRGLVGEGPLVQRCGVGDVGVAFAGPAPDDLVELVAVPRDLSGPVPEAVVTLLVEDLGLETADVTGEARVAGAGLSFVHVPVRAEALARARPGRGDVGALVAERWPQAPVHDLLDSVNLYAVAGRAPSLSVRSRVFVPGLAVPEDPATGSCAAGLGMALVATGVLPEGGAYEIAQGVEMGRPSRLHGRVEVEDGAAVRMRVAGRVAPSMRGTIRVPPAGAAGG